jgi:hypothetical protein
MQKMIWSSSKVNMHTDFQHLLYQEMNKIIKKTQILNAKYLITIY